APCSASFASSIRRARSFFRWFSELHEPSRAYKKKSCGRDATRRRFFYKVILLRVRSGSLGLADFRCRDIARDAVLGNLLHNDLGSHSKSLLIELHRFESRLVLFLSDLVVAHQLYGVLLSFIIRLRQLDLHRADLLALVGLSDVEFGILTVAPRAQCIQIGA